MKDIYYFADSWQGIALRSNLASHLVANGIEVRLFTEDVRINGPRVGEFTLVPLRGLESGRRPSEGKVAKDMKARKTVREFIQGE